MKNFVTKFADNAKNLMVFLRQTLLFEFYSSNLNFSISFEVQEVSVINEKKNYYLNLRVSRDIMVD